MPNAIDLRAEEPGAENREFICGQVNPVRVGANMWSASGSFYEDGSIGLALSFSSAYSVGVPGERGFFALPGVAVFLRVSKMLGFAL